MPQTDPAHFRNDHGPTGTDLHAWPLGIQQSGTMDLPIDPFVGSNEHADSAVGKRQESVREPNDDVSAGSASLDEHRCAITHALLDVIDANTIHEPRHGSLNGFHHQCVACARVKLYSDKSFIAKVLRTMDPPPGSILM